MIVIAIWREIRVLRLVSFFLSRSSAVPPPADIDLKFEPGMSAGIDRVRFHSAKVSVALVEASANRHGISHGFILPIHVGTSVEGTQTMRCRLRLDIAKL